MSSGPWDLPHAQASGDGAAQPVAWKNGVNPDFVTVSRVVAERVSGGSVPDRDGRMKARSSAKYLIKWKGLEDPYDNLSWERAEDLSGPEFERELARFKARQQPIAVRTDLVTPNKVSSCIVDSTGGNILAENMHSVNIMVSGP